MIVKKTSIERVIQAAQMDLGFPDLTPFEIIEYTGRALEQCQAVPSMKEYTAFCEVVNHRVTMPPGLIYIQQIARNNCFEAEPTCPIILADQAEEVPENCVMEPAVIDCNGNLLNGCDYSYYRPFFTGQLAFYSFYGTDVAKECYSPVRLANHSFFSSIVCKEHDGTLYDPDCRDEYGIDNNDIILSFPSGQIAISYFGPELDEKGNMLVPDHETFIKAFVAYIRYQKNLKRYDSQPNGPNANALDRAEADWHWYCRQAINTGLFEGGKDGMQDLRDINGWILPPGNRYDKFFGNLTYKQNRPNILGAEHTISG